MKQYIISIYLVLIVFVGLAFNSQAIPFTDGNSNNYGSEVNGVASYSSSILDTSNLLAEKGNYGFYFQSISSSVPKYTFSKPFSEKNFEATNNNIISGYICFAELHVPGLESTDIIHPFNYFW